MTSESGKRVEKENTRSSTIPTIPEFSESTDKLSKGSGALAEKSDLLKMYKDEQNAKQLEFEHNILQY